MTQSKRRHWIGLTLGVAAAIAVGRSTPIAAAQPNGPPSQGAAPASPSTVPLADVCEFRVERNHLVLRTKLASMTRQVRTLSDKIDGLPGTSTVRIERGEPGSDDAPVFYLINNNPNAANASVVQTQVSCSNGQISIHQHRQLPDGWQVVTFSQGGDASDDGPAVAAADPYAVTLTVTRSQDPAQRVYCAAADWSTLRRECGPEVEQYVRPLFQSLRQDAVFAIEPGVAWQVFEAEAKVGAKADAKADAGVGERIRRLLPRLDDDDVAARHVASQALMKEGIPGMLFLRNFRPRHLSPEQANRLDAFMASFTLLEDDEVEAYRSDPNFLLDCLYGSDASVRAVAIKRLGTLAHKTLEMPAADRLHEVVAQWRRELAGRQ